MERANLDATSAAKGLHHTPVVADFVPMPLPGFAGYLCHLQRGTGAHSGEFLFEVEARHLNFGQRLHGGMLMTLQTTLLSQVAADAMHATAPSAKLKLVSFNCDFIGSVTTGAMVYCDAAVTRLTRSLVFVSGSLGRGDALLMTGAAIYRIERTEVPA
ncbi:MAG: PaaI family thioesterase [Janthinobacterium lividum]